MTNDANEDGYPEGFRALMRTIQAVRRISNPLGANAAAVTRSMEIARLVSNPLREHAATISRAIEGAQRISPVAAQISALTMPVVAAIQPWRDVLRSVTLNERVYRVARELAEIVESAQKPPERSREAYARMAEHGWYFDGDHMDLNEPMEIAGALIRDADAANEMLAARFEARLDTIEMDLVARHPLRAVILHDAIAAHREGKYTLSIPTLLAQADGICQDSVGAQLYGVERKTGQTRLARVIDAMNLDVYTAAILSPLKLISPLVANRDERTPGDGKLNRHVVVHGESTDYPTRINSLRTISLVWFVSWAFEFAKDMESGSAPERAS